MKEAVIERCDGVVRARLRCEIDHHTAKIIREAIDLELERGGVSLLELDFSEVGFMDSSGIGLVIGRAPRAEAIGAKILLTGLSPSLLRLIRMSGVERLECITVRKG